MVDEPVPLGAPERHDLHDLVHVFTSFADLALEKIEEWQITNAPYTLASRVRAIFVLLETLMALEW